MYTEGMCLLSQMKILKDKYKFTCDLISKFNFCYAIVIQDELVESVICNNKFNIMGMKKKERNFI